MKKRKYKHIRTVLRVVSHRNGVGGDPFVAIEFMGFVARKEKLLYATVFDRPGCVAVIDAFNIGDRFRGDVFESELRAVVKQWSESWDDKACLYTWPRVEPSQ